MNAGCPGRLPATPRLICCWGSRIPPASLPRYPDSAADNSSYLNFPGEGIVRYGEGIFIGYRAYDKLVQPVSYPFGFGLSYTSFRIDDVNVWSPARWLAAILL